MEFNLQFFLLVSLIMGLVIALLFVISSIFGKQISAKTRYLMWIVIMIGLIIPFRPTVGSGMVEIPNFMTQAENYSPVLNEGGFNLGEIPGVPASGTSAEVVTNNVLSFQNIVLVVWISVAVAIVGYHLVQYTRFQKSIKRWGEAESDPNTLAIFADMKREMGVASHQIQLIVCGFVSTSMLTGFFRPAILLPEKNYDDSELELIFRHELIHYRRKDLWIKLLSVVAIAIHWFNPFVYLMNFALQTEGEASCDQEVIERSALKNRQFYAEVIIGMIGGKKSGMTTLATNFYGGKKGIKRRLEEVMAGAKPLKSISAVALLLILGLTLMSGSVFAISTATGREQNVVSPPVERNYHAYFDLAIQTVGGGEVIDFRLMGTEIIVVYVTHADDVYIVEINTAIERVVGLNIQQNYEPTPTPEPELPAEDINSQSTGISSEEAGQIALNFSGGRLVEVSRDSWRGQPAWWVETRANGRVHEFYISAETGDILEHESEIDD